METVRLRECGLLDGHLPALSTILFHAGAINLDLSNNILTPHGLQALIGWNRPGLLDLNLSNNWFGPAGLELLAAFLETDATLQHLNVSNSGARPADASRLDSDQRAVQKFAEALQVRICLLFFVYSRLLVITK